MRIRVDHGEGEKDWVEYDVREIELLGKVTISADLDVISIKEPNEEK